MPMRVPNEAGRGAERLAAPNAHAFTNKSRWDLVSSWAVEPANGKLTWVEGSVDDEAAHRIESTALQ